MPEVEEVRRDNLAALVIEYGGQKQLAQQTGLNPAQISQWLNRSINTSTGKPRVMHRRSARKIEHALNLPDNWLDSPQDTATPISPSRTGPAPAALMRWKEFPHDLANCLYALGKTAQADRRFASILKNLQDVGLRLHTHRSQAAARPADTANGHLRGADGPAPDYIKAASAQ